MNDKNTQLTVIIRSSGERTFELCKNLIQRQAPGVQIYAVQAAPFEEALRESCRIGIKDSKKWTLMVDADILLHTQAISRLLLAAESAPEKLFQINGIVYDKFLNEPRSAGVRLYRTSVLDEVLKTVPPNGTEVRPENYSRKKLEEHGWLSFKTDFVAGIHDFEQYYRDVYRKAMLHGHKNFSNTSDALHRWYDNKASDPDYAVAIKGFAQGVINPAPPKLDSRTFDSAAAILTELGIAEKEPIAIPDDYVEKYEAHIEEMLVERFPTRCQRYGLLWRKRGVLCALVNSLGGIFLHIGRAICAAGDRLGKRES